MRLPRLLLIVAFLCAFLPAADAQASNPFTGGSLTSPAVYRAPLLQVSADMADGGAYSFVVPPKPHPTFTRFEWRVVYSYRALVGGQNRSGAPHPGYEMFSGSFVHLWHYFVRDDGSLALPGMGASRAIHNEWGPTLPAPESGHVPIEELPLHADDPSVYWGPRAFNPDEPVVVATSHTLDGSWMLPQPGERVTLVTEGVWAVEGWDGSHAWPYRIDWLETVVAWGRWLPPGGE